MVCGIRRIKEMECFFFSSRRRHTRFALVRGLGDVYKGRDWAAATLLQAQQNLAAPGGNHCREMN